MAPIDAGHQLGPYRQVRYITCCWNNHGRLKAAVPKIVVDQGASCQVRRVDGQRSRTRYKHVHVGSDLAFPGQTRSWNAARRLSTSSEAARFESPQATKPLWEAAGRRSALAANGSAEQSYRKNRDTHAAINGSSKCATYAKNTKAKD